MAAPLKDLVGAEFVQRVADDLVEAHPAFDVDHFCALATSGLDELELKARAEHIADALQATLPEPYPEAARVLVASLGPPIEGTEDFGMEVLGYLAHVTWVAKYGLHDVETSLAVQQELTRRFTCEFSIRAFIEHDPERTWQQLHTWAVDPDPHLRRLASEGTRPRLPWAPQLRSLRKDPTAVLRLLEVLKDDPVRYVQRSVANNLNDIGKDHPDRLIATCRRWLEAPTEGRDWIVRHALRSRIKAGDPDALHLLGFAEHPKLEVVDVALPGRAAIGDTLRFSLGLQSTATEVQPLLVDYVVHFVKANGESRPKVFKLTRLDLEPGARASLKHRISLKQHTTRKHYPGTHRIDLRINGVDHPLASFELEPQ